ncbi:nucleoside 2-deoxyribosyltransferase [Streptomyces thermoalcalitolerans]|uniref:Nucleoside 2-deoxyribosyltransferase n=1 Tax=Streptomyces thermoalcalitolerans TaxID=65605 RepID=A0ABN1NF70_9ACTN
MTAPSNAPRPALPGVNSIFLAGPFMGLVDSATGRMPDAACRPFTVLIEHFEQYGIQVYNAHRREAWGEEVLAPAECTALDQKEIENADVFVAIPGIPPSPGTHIEMGWASVLGKPIVLLMEEGREEEYGYLVRGLGSVATVEFVYVTDIASALADIDAAIRRAVSRLPASA